MTDEIPLKDVLVLLHVISLSGESLRGKTRLHKLVFLSQVEEKGKFDYEFGSAPLGPLSSKLNHTLERMPSCCSP